MKIVMVQERNIERKRERNGNKISKSDPPSTREQFELIMEDKIVYKRKMWKREESIKKRLKDKSKVRDRRKSSSPNAWSTAGVGFPCNKMEASGCSPI